jgi:hypothetical protein
LGPDGAKGVITHRAYRGAQGRLEIKPDADVPSIIVDVPATVEHQPGDVVFLQVAGKGHVFA